MENQIEEIQQTINTLEGPVLTIYLNTDPTNEEWRIHLKNGLKKTAEYVEASAPDDVKQFATIRKQVENLIKDNQNNFKNSLICFATQDEIFIHHFHFRVENDFQWNKEPVAEQLNNLFESYPKCGVILLRKDNIALISSILGEWIEEVQYQFDVDTEDWKQYKGLGFANVYASSANHRDKFDRRMRVNQERFYKRIVPIIEKNARKQEWKNTHLAGPVELTQQMRDLLNIPITGETTRNYTGNSAQDILNKTVLAGEDDK